MRPGEHNGRDYTFLTDKEFGDGIVSGRFVEWAEVHCHWYGTPREPLDQALSAGHDVMLDLDVIGGLRLKECYDERAITLFIMPPSIDELTNRLRARGTDSFEVQAIRLKNALTEITFADRFDHRVINDDLDRVCTEIESILALDKGNKAI